MIARVVRVTTYALAVTLGLGVFAAKRASAELHDSASSIGDELLRLADEPSDDHELTLDGQTVHISSAETERSLGDVLERFQKSCEEHADGLSHDLSDLGAALSRAPNDDGSPGIGILRDERAGRGVVACFAAGKNEDASGLAARLHRFARSHELSDIGGLRYIAAREVGGRTRVVATWTDARLALDEMFPATGDAAGHDPRDAPRPAHARRILSAHDERAPHGVFVYEVGSGALADYERQALQRGFTNDEAVAAREPNVRAFAKDGIDVVVSAGDGVLSIVEMPVRRAR